MRRPFHKEQCSSAYPSDADMVLDGQAISRETPPLQHHAIWYDHILLHFLVQNGLALVQRKCRLVDVRLSAV
jgi:hypothetical protein